MQEHDRQSAGADRRRFMKLGAAGIAAASSALSMQSCASAGRKVSGASPDMLFAAPPIRRKVRIGFVGTGGMGTAHCRNLIRIGDCEIAAVCDIVPEKAENVQRLCVEAGKPKPAAYTRGPKDYVRLCQEEDLDLVYTATPWELHVPVCVTAMRNGKHAATEVPAALTVEECWQLVETAEQLGKHCVMMENCCYGEEELMVLNMVRKGLFGEILHGECGYLHDLRDIKFGKGGEALWRTRHSIERNANLYPTHGLGPVAQYMDVNRGDRFDYLVSMSSPSRGLNLYAAEKFGANDPRATQNYALGDVNVTLIKTYNGKTIYLVHDTNLPRPYSRINMIQGTRGLFRGYPQRIHVEGRSEPHQWDSVLEYRREFQHPLWKQMQEMSKGAGHGGMDFIEDYRLVQCLKEGTPTDQNVYDAAAWSVVTELTERSVADKSRTMDFPDFTRGGWKTCPPLGIVTI